MSSSASTSSDSWKEKQRPREFNKKHLILDRYRLTNGLSYFWLNPPLSIGSVLSSIRRFESNSIILLSRKSLKFEHFPCHIFRIKFDNEAPLQFSRFVHNFLLPERFKRLIGQCKLLEIFHTIICRYIVILKMGRAIINENFNSYVKQHTDASEMHLNGEATEYIGR